MRLKTSTQVRSRGRACVLLCNSRYNKDKRKKRTARLYFHSQSFIRQIPFIVSSFSRTMAHLVIRSDLGDSVKNAAATAERISGAVPVGRATPIPRYVAALPSSVMIIAGLSLCIVRPVWGAGQYVAVTVQSMPSFLLFPDQRTQECPRPHRRARVFRYCALYVL